MGTQTKTGMRILSALLVCAISASIIAAVPSNSSAPAALLNGAPASEVLGGNAAGAFAYYTVTYPGDGTVATVELWFAPADPVTVSGVGFNVYGPDGTLVGQGGPSGEDTGGDGLLVYDYSSTDPVTLLVQVYNYIEGGAISYTITATGFAQAQAAAVEPSAEPAAQPATTTSAAAQSGALAGSSQGAFAYYSIAYPGDESVTTIDLWFAPADPVTVSGVGFNVYGPDGTLVGQGGPSGEDTGGAGLLRLGYAGSEPVTLLVQVYNYIEGTTIHYTLSD
jgi:hypothetical protein